MTGDNGQLVFSFNFVIQRSDCGEQKASLEQADSEKVTETINNGIGSL